MHAFKTLATLISRLAQLVAPWPEGERPLTEDDIRADRYLRRQHARG